MQTRIFSISGRMFLGYWQTRIFSISGRMSLGYWQTQIFSISGRMSLGYWQTRIHIQHLWSHVSRILTDTNIQHLGSHVSRILTDRNIQHLGSHVSRILTFTESCLQQIRFVGAFRHVSHVGLDPSFSLSVIFNNQFTFICMTIISHDLTHGQAELRPAVPQSSWLDTYLSSIWYHVHLYILSLSYSNSLVSSLSLSVLALTLICLFCFVFHLISLVFNLYLKVHNCLYCFWES